MNGKIYKITNTITGECYIGQTVRSVERRFEEHKQGTRQAKYKMSKLQKAMEEYGKRNFTVELIEDEIETIEELCEKEKYYIQKYNATFDYNNSSGGENNLKSSGNEKNKFIVKIHSSIENQHLWEFTSQEIDLLFFIFLLLKSSDDDTATLNSILLREMTDKFDWSPSKLNNVANSLLSKINNNSNELLFSKFELKNGELTVSLNEKCLYMIEGKHSNNCLKFSIFQLFNINGKNSKILYAILSQWRTKGLKRYTPNELYETMGFPESYLGDKKKIKTKVINPAIKGIGDAIPGLKVEVEYYGRSVSAYLFSWKR